MTGVGMDVVIFSVVSPCAVKVMAPQEDCAALLFVFVRPSEAATSAAVTAEPSENLRPEANVMVHSLSESRTAAVASWGTSSSLLSTVHNFSPIPWLTNDHPVLPEAGSLRHAECKRGGHR